MRVFEHSYECYVPDSQLIFPHIFLKDLNRLPDPNKLFYKCFDLMDKHCEIKILPANESDIGSLILNKFYPFMKNIRAEIERAQRNKLSRESFFKRANGILRSKDYGDLIYYWAAKKEVFWDLVSKDLPRINKKITELSMEIMARFYEIKENRCINYTDEEKERSESLYEALNNLQQSGRITTSADSNDLMILADCLVYKETRLPYGVIYLVTGDGELQKISSEIIQKPYLIYPELSLTYILTGFRMLRPDELIRGIETNLSPDVDL